MVLRVWILYSLGHGRLYLDEKRTKTEIAVLLSISRAPMSAVLRETGISPPGFPLGLLGGTRHTPRDGPSRDNRRGQTARGVPCDGGAVVRRGRHTNSRPKDRHQPVPRAVRAPAAHHPGVAAKPNLRRFLGAVGVLTCWFARNTRRNVVTNLLDFGVIWR